MSSNDFARQVGLSIGRQVSPSYRAAMIALEETRAAIRSVCPDRADELLASSHDRIMIGVSIDVQSDLEHVYRTACRYGCGELFDARIGLTDLQQGIIDSMNATSPPEDPGEFPY